MRKAVLTALATTLLLASPALAADNPLNETVKARQGYFRLYGANLGKLADMAKGKVEYDARKAQLHADNISKIASTSHGFLFVPGTSTDDMPGMTRALPAIWADLPGFAAASKNCVDASHEIAKVASEGRAALGAGVQKVGAACKQCHDKYRAK